MLVYGPDLAIRPYEEDLRDWLSSGRALEGEMLALGENRLACWCAPQPCHGDVLVRDSRQA